MTHVAKFFEILLVNFVLSGDNAVVIAFATLRLDPRSRRLAILYGTAAAVMLRVWLTLIASRLFSVPYVQAGGGVLLAYLALSLLAARERADETRPAPRRLLTATASIALADVTMSLDNVAALAGIAHGDREALFAGLLVSVSLIMFASASLAGMMSQRRFLQTIGAGVLAWTAGGMIGHDPALADAFAAAPFAPAVACLGIVTAVYGAARLFSSSG